MLQRRDRSATCERGINDEGQIEEFHYEYEAHMSCGPWCGGFTGAVDPCRSDGSNCQSLTPYAVTRNSPQGINQPAVGSYGFDPADRGAGEHDKPDVGISLGAPGETGQQMMDKQFVRSAAEGGMADVKIGTLAVEKGGPEVKAVGEGDGG